MLGPFICLPVSYGILKDKFQIVCKLGLKYNIMHYVTRVGNSDSGLLYPTEYLCFGSSILNVLVYIFHAEFIYKLHFQSL